MQNLTRAAARVIPCAAGAVTAADPATTGTNGITEGFHRKMKLIQRRAYGFRNFANYRLRVIAQCG
jgi:transposase